MKPKRKLLVLIDAHALIHRAYHALPEFSSTDGQPTGALYGVSTMLMRVFKDLKPDYIASCFDLPKPTFRHIAYEAYKGKRKESDDALVAQIKRSKDLFLAFGIQCFELEGFEADDLLGTIVEKYVKDKNLDIIIVSGDMDTMQLIVGTHVRVFTLKKGLNDVILYDEKKVIERYGFTPKQIPDYKGLAGDPSDNIIGVQGIGEKTATELIKVFGSIEGIYKALKKDKQKLLDAGIKERVLKLLEEQEEEANFSKALATIRRDAPIDFKLPLKEWKDEFDPLPLEQMFEKLEFKSLKSRAKTLTNFEAKEAESKTKKEGIPKKEEKKIEIVDQALFEKAQVALWLLDSDKTNPELETVLAVAKTKNLEEALVHFESELQKRGLWDLYSDIEMPLTAVVRKMEVIGIQLDVEYVKKLSADYHKELDILEKQIYKAAGKEFNINSPKQLGEILFDHLGLTAKGLKKTSGGARSTNIDALEKLQGSHEIIEYIMKHRELQKLVSTYLDPLPTLVDEHSRLHTHFIQTGAATGRFSSQNPNLQNIPVKNEHGTAIRKAFVAAPGYTLLSCDYSQIELRVAAILSQDENLLKIFRDGGDVHASVAARVFHVDEKLVTAEQRRVSKVLNFGIMYGMGVNALKENLGSDRKSAQEFYDAYRATFSRLNTYLEEVKENARNLGYTETLFGRQRQLKMLRSPLPFIRAQGERMAINAPIQGTAADILRVAIIDVDTVLTKTWSVQQARLLLQVHDELIFEVATDLVEDVKKAVVPTMEKVLEIYKKEAALIPLKVSANIGASWGDLK